jgi:hypothetical protein
MSQSCLKTAIYLVALSGMVSPRMRRELKSRKFQDRMASRSPKVKNDSQLEVQMT